MSETKGAKRRKPPNKYQPTKAQMEEVIVIPATLDQLAAAVLAGGRRAATRSRMTASFWPSVSGPFRSALSTARPRIGAAPRPLPLSLAALVGGDVRVIDAHDRAVMRTLDWFEKNVAETRMKDPETGRMARTGNQKAVISTFRHDTSRNLDPALHTHSVIANMLKGADGAWRSMANEKLHASKMLLGAMYRNELARDLATLGYGIEKTHADGRFEIVGVPREIVMAFSTRRAEIEAAMDERGLGATAANQRLAQRAALFTRAAKRDVDRVALRASWERQAASLGFDVRALAAEAVSQSAGMEAARETVWEGGAGERQAGRDGAAAAGSRETAAPALGEAGPRAGPPEIPAARAVAWAVSHLSEREAVFARTDLLAAALAWSPGAASAADIERETALERAGTLHAVRLPGLDDALTTDRAVADEKETIALMETDLGALKVRSRPDRWRMSPSFVRRPSRFPPPSGTRPSSTATAILPPEGPVPGAASQRAATGPTPGRAAMVPARPAAPSASPDPEGPASNTSAEKRGPRQVSMTVNPENVPPAWIAWPARGSRRATARIRPTSAPMRSSLIATFRRKDGRTLHVRKATRAEPE